MPYIYIGRKTSHIGKTLWEIVGNLKDFGIGRLITRGTHQRYEEPSFFKIIKVFPQPYEPTETRKVAVIIEKVFRGRKYPELALMRHSTIKSDFQLIPKDEEHIWWKRMEEKQIKDKVLSDTITAPPLLKELLMKEASDKSKHITEPMLKLKYRRTSNNFIQVVSKAEDPSVKPETGLGTPFAASLYRNIDSYLEAKEASKSTKV